MGSIFGGSQYTSGLGGSMDFVTFPVTGNNEDLDMNGYKVIHMAEPSDNSDATTKSYVDSSIAGLAVSQDVVLTASGINGASSFTDLTAELTGDHASYDFHVAVYVTATPSLSCVYHVTVETASASIAIDRVGADAGLNFRWLTTEGLDGKLQYTSPSYSGFSSMSFRYRFSAT